MIEGFKKQGLVGSVLDSLLVPFMYLLQGSIRESPQRTHRWNNIKVRQFSQVVRISDRCEFVTVSGDPTATRRWFGIFPLFHMPAVGGWKKYVVLEPEAHEGEWFIGWSTKDVTGVSQVPVVGKVRSLIGPNTVSFFGMTEAGDPVPLVFIGEGRIGVFGRFSKLPLR